MDSAAVYMTDVPREEQERRGKIRTFTGKLVDPLNLAPDDISIIDIGHHLSNLCRYTGAVPMFYSVAQHSVIVSRCFVDPMMKLAGLLHDAAEAYINDVASPVKHSAGFQFYRELDDRITATIFGKFGLDPAVLKEVKPFDDSVFKREVASFWNFGRNLAAGERVLAMPPISARTMFALEYQRISRKLLRPTEAP